MWLIQISSDGCPHKQKARDISFGYFCINPILKGKSTLCKEENCPVKLPGWF